MPSATLPLLARATRHPGGLIYETPRMPGRVPGRGEQYRFHFDMRKCIGCKCCVVACNEQNGNPAAINWRRVGEIEGGFFPHATRTFLSMGCNHCLEPTCLSGCPVDAYSKDAATGIVHHSAEACIGCQYCTWNCSYGVPQYNAERGVVGKCDMCHGRLSLGQAPACVTACPEGAIQIEVVAIDDWRRAASSDAPAPGVPIADGSLATTRVTLPAEMPPNARPRDITHVAPVHAHWSLILMTVLTQLSVGAFVTIWLLHLVGAPALGRAAFCSVMVGGIALTAATFHLGRPIYAYRALRMWRRSWLSREVLLFAAFSAIAALYAAALWLQLPGGVVVGGITAILGLAGITASGCIYRVPSRAAWNTPLTLMQFHLTAGLLGPLCAAAAGAGDPQWLGVASALMGGGQLLVLAAGFLRCIATDSLELRGTARLLSTVLARKLVARGVLLVVGGVVLPLVAPGAAVVALALALGGELLGRYLFFVSAVPTHPAAPYLPAAREAA